MTDPAVRAVVEEAPLAPSWLASALRVSGGLLALLPFLQPLAARAGLVSLAAVLDRPWTMLCHRMPERSLRIAGELMPICSRCLGLVLGLGLGLMLARPALSIRALRIAVSLGATFMFFELTTQDLGWHPVFHPTRILSGLLVAFPIGAAASSLVRKLGEPAASMMTTSTG
jgi:uncharacterized membrane protein